MDDAENAIFSRAVNFVLPNSIPTHFDRSEEYQVGDVLVYEKKLHPLMPWRKHKLIFTGVNISSLLTESVQLDNGVQEVFSDSSTTWTFGESAKVDAQIMCAIAKLGIHVAESEHATMSVNFGRIDRHFSNLAHLPTRQAADKKLHVLADHPVIRDAKAHNRTLFVINNLYVAEKADVSLSYASGHGSKDTGTDTKQAQAPATNPPTSTADTTGTTQQPQATPASGKTSTIGANIDLSVEMSGHSGNGTFIHYSIHSYRLPCMWNPYYRLNPVLCKFLSHMYYRNVCIVCSGEERHADQYCLSGDEV